MSHPSKELFKKILEDAKFDIPKFLANDYENFWGVVLDYVEKFRIPKESKFFRRVKSLNYKKLHKIFAKLIPLSNKSHYTDGVIVKINQVFQYLLHSGTPEEIRTLFIQLLFNIMEILPDDRCLKLLPTIVHVIPFVRLAKGEKETSLINGSITAKAQPITNTQLRLGTPEDVYLTYSQFLKWINMNWVFKQNACCKLILDQLFSILYNHCALASKYSNNRVGLNHVVDKMHEQTLEYFKSTFEIDISINSFFTKAESIEFIFQILEQGKTQEFVENEILIFEKIISKDEYVTTIIETKSESFGNIYPRVLALVAQFIKPGVDIPQNVEEAAISFVNAFVNTALKKYGHTLMETLMNNMLKYNRSNTKFQMYLILWFMNALIENKVSDPSVWQILSTLVSNDRIAAAAACKFAHFLGLLQIPSVFTFSIDDTLNACSDLCARVKSGKASVRNQLFVENAAMIIDNPQQFARQCQVIFFDSLKEFVPLTSELNMPIFDMSKLTDESIDNACEAVLTAFATYEYKNGKERALCASPIICYYATIASMVDLPTFIDYDEGMPLAFSRKHLFKLLIDEPCEELTWHAIKVLQKMIATPDAKPFVDSETLSTWYGGLGLAMLSKDDVLRMTAFEAALDSIRCGLAGSTMLVALMLHVSENADSKFYPLVLSFIENIPIFKDGGLIEPVRSFVKCEVNEKDLKERAFKLLIKISPHADSVSALRAFLVDSYVSTPEHNDKVLDLLMSKIEDKDHGAVLVLQSHPIHANEDILKRLLKMCRSAMEMEPDFSFDLLKASADVFVLHFDLVSNLKIADDFADVLSSFIEQEKNKDLRNAVVGIQNAFVSRFGIQLKPCVGVSVIGDRLNDPFRVATSTTLYDLKRLDDSISIAAQTTLGQSIWDFNVVEEGLDQAIEGCHPEFCLKINPDDSDPLFDGQDLFNASFEETLSNINAFRGSTAILAPGAHDTDKIDLTGPYRNAKESVPDLDTKLPTLSTFASLGVLEDLKLVVENVTSRKVTKLHETSPRMTERIGVIYSRSGSSEESEVLGANIDDVSPQFLDMLNGLGYNIDLANHKQYLAGLENSKAPSSIYYEDINTEIMFHIAPLITSDDTMLCRKKHLGTDSIQIVWSEPPGHYDESAVSSSYTKAVIIIYPLQSNLLSIETITRKPMKVLMDKSKTIVTQKMLPLYIRSAATLAYNQGFVTSTHYSVATSYIDSILQDVISNKDAAKDAESYIIKKSSEV